MRIFTISTVVALVFVSFADAGHNSLRGNAHAAQLEARADLPPKTATKPTSFADKKGEFLKNFYENQAKLGYPPKMEAHAKAGEGNDRLNKLAQADMQHFQPTATPKKVVKFH